jgi:hypothetical protein
MARGKTPRRGKMPRSVDYEIHYAAYARTLMANKGCLVVGSSAKNSKRMSLKIGGSTLRASETDVYSLTDDKLLCRLLHSRVRKIPLLVLDLLELGLGGG